MSHNDSNFFKTFAVVLGALVVFTLLIAVIANIYSPASDRASDPLVQKEQARQIAPVGKNRVAEAPAAELQQAVTQVEKVEETTAVADESTAEEAPAAGETAQAESTEAEPVADASATAETAEATAVTETQAVVSTVTSAEASDIPLRVKAVVATNCAGCHQDGLHGAQRSDDSAAWSALSEKGLDTLTSSVINGKGAMLPRAETSLTDEEISLAVSHMIAQATGGMTKVSKAESAATSTETAATDSAAVETTEETAEVADAAAQETAESESSTTETAVAAAPATEVPANVKAVVDSLCAGCHISGVANAPKYGDKAAWDQRLAMGMDKLLASAIAGKGAMPARGGSQLSDAELRLAIEYMASK